MSALLSGTINSPIVISDDEDEVLDTPVTPQWPQRQLTHTVKGPPLVSLKTPVYPDNNTIDISAPSARLKRKLRESGVSQEGPNKHPKNTPNVVPNEAPNDAQTAHNVNGAPMIHRNSKQKNGPSSRAHNPVPHPLTIPAPAKQDNILLSPEQILGWAAPHHQHTHSPAMGFHTGPFPFRFPEGAQHPMMQFNDAVLAESNCFDFGGGSQLPYLDSQLPGMPTTLHQLYLATENMLMTQAGPPHQQNNGHFPTPDPPAGPPPGPAVPQKFIGSHDTGGKTRNGVFLEVVVNDSTKEMLRPDRNRTLVMQCLCPSFRQNSMILSWAEAFGTVEHVQVDAKRRRAIIVFANPVYAVNAFNSPQLKGADGRNNLRVYWLQGLAAPAYHKQYPPKHVPAPQSLPQPKPLPQPLPATKSVSLPQPIPPNVPISKPPPPKSASLPQLPKPAPVSLPTITRYKLIPRPPPSQPREMEEGEIEEDSPAPRPIKAISVPAKPPQKKRENAPASPKKQGGNKQKNTESTQKIAPRDGKVKTAVVVPPNLPSSSKAASSGILNQQSEPPPSQHIHQPKPEPAWFSGPPPEPSSTPPALPIQPKPPPTGSNEPSSESSTPTPSEPRATRNIPKGPSFATRTLIAKQKQTDGVTDNSPTTTSTSPTPPPPTAASNGLPSTPTLSATPPTPLTTLIFTAAEKLAREENLRRLVLESKRKKAQSATQASISTAGPKPVSPMLQNTTFTIPTSTRSASPAAPSLEKTSESSTPPTPSMEDLAISFIVEAIQSATPSTKATPPPPPHAELETRQARLEQHIAESKVLMTKFTNAETKEERSLIMKIMRERNRIMDELMKTPAEAPATRKWPESHPNAGILVLTDDDDSEEE